MFPLQVGNVDFELTTLELQLRRVAGTRGLRDLRICVTVLSVQGITCCLRRPEVGMMTAASGLVAERLLRPVVLLASGAAIAGSAYDPPTSQSPVTHELKLPAHRPASRVRNRLSRLNFVPLLPSRPSNLLLGPERSNKLILLAPGSLLAEAACRI